MSGSDKHKAGSVEYQNVDDDYFARRGLRRYAGVWSLWALGVGAVISGNFFGWNFGLSVGGFGGLAIAMGIVAVMYLGICYSIAEMSPALPHTGGAYSFGRTSMGPWGGFITGLAENMEYIITPAAIVVGIGSYAGAAFNGILGIDIPGPVWWLIFYILFVGLNIVGVEATFKFSVFITLLTLAILLVFWVGAIPHFSWDMALNIEPDAGNSRFLPFGWSGIAQALPFAIWFYLAIEQLPLAAEESRDPKRDMPKALLWGILTLIVASILTLLLNAGIAPGAAEVGQSEEPLFLAFTTIFGSGDRAAFMALVAITGLVASFHTIIYAYGRNIYSLSRSGYLPQWLSVTLPNRKTPYAALIAGAVIGYCVALLIEFGDDWFGADAPVAAVLLNMAVFGAVAAYGMQMIAFVRLRNKFPLIERPYVSPLGNPGAIVAGLIAFATLCFLFLNPDYRVGIYGCAVWFAAGLLYFAVAGRKKLVYSPEEDFAMKHTPRSDT